MNAQDQENISKAAHSANFLAQDLQRLVESENPLLADVALDLLEQAARLRQRLSRLETVARGKLSTT